MLAANFNVSCIVLLLRRIIFAMDTAGVAICQSVHQDALAFHPNATDLPSLGVDLGISMDIGSMRYCCLHIMLSFNR